MRVLIVSQYFWPESFLINEVAASLLRAGCEVSVLTGQPNYPGGNLFPGYRMLSVRRETYQGCSVVRVPLAPRGRGGALRLAANYLSFVVAASVLGPWLFRRQTFDVVFVYGISPILQVIPALAMRGTRGGVVVPWVQDLWPESLEVTGFVRNRRLLAMVSRVVRWLYRRSDLLLVQSPGFVPLVSAMSFGVPVIYHPNPAQAPVTDGDGQPEGRLTLAAGFNVVFAGNLGTVQALDTVLSAAELLRDVADLRFVLIGSGSQGQWIANEIARLGLTNVQMAGRYPPEDMPGIFAQASALLVSLARSPIMEQTIPSKLQAYLAAGRPIIASLDGEGARVAQESGAGISCPAEDARSLADAVLQLQSRPAHNLREMGDAGRRYYHQHFDPAVLTSRLIRHFDDALARRDS